MSGEYPIKQLCEILEVSRSGYYDWLAADRSARQQAEAALQAQIQSVHQTSGETYGSPRVTVALRQQGAKVGRRRVARLMRQAGLRGNQKPRFRVATTDSRHDHPIAPNLLLGQPVPIKPDRVWVTDIMPVPGLCRVGASVPSAEAVVDAA